MTHRHMETITFGTCLVICARTHTRARTHAHTHFDIGTGTVGLLCLQALSWGGGLCFCHTFFGGGGGGLRTTLGGGLDSGVWEGVLFFASQVVFCCIFLMLMRKCNFEVAGMPCNAVQCRGVLLSRKV